LLEKEGKEGKKKKRKKKSSSPALLLFGISTLAIRITFVQNKVGWGWGAYLLGWIGSLGFRQSGFSSSRVLLFVGE
jgi:hypothetical protein